MSQTMETSESSSDVICKFERESNWAKVIWLLLGLLIGFFISQSQYHSQLEDQRVEKIDLWTAAVIAEIDYNIEHRLTAPSFVQRQGAERLKRQFTFTAMGSFVDRLPEMYLEEGNLSQECRDVLEMENLANYLSNRQDELITELEGISDVVGAVVLGNQRELKQARLSDYDNALERLLSKVCDAAKLLRQKMTIIRSQHGLA